MNKHFYINKFAVWEASDDVELPDVGFVPSMLRRRLTAVEKIGIYLANQVCENRNDYFVVFASRFGEWGQTIKLIKQFYEDRELSPSGFSSSVHNAMPGLLSVLTHNTNSYTTVASKENTIDNGLLEAMISNSPVFFIYAEEATPEFYKSKFDKSFRSHGVAILFSNEKIGCEIEVVSKYNENKSVSFGELVKFLNDGENLSCNHFDIRKI